MHEHVTEGWNWNASSRSHRAEIGRQLSVQFGETRGWNWRQLVPIEAETKGSELRLNLRSTLGKQVGEVTWNNWFQLEETIGLELEQLVVQFARDNEASADHIGTIGVAPLKVGLHTGLENWNNWFHIDQGNKGSRNWNNWFQLGETRAGIPSKQLGFQLGKQGTGIGKQLSSRLHETEEG